MTSPRPSTGQCCERCWEKENLRECGDEFCPNCHQPQQEKKWPCLAFGGLCTHKSCEPVQDTGLGKWRQLCEKQFSPCWNDEDEAFIERLLEQTRREALREALDLVHKHDPQTDKPSGKTYWGNTLKADIITRLNETEG